MNGKDWSLCLTLGALAWLEQALGAENLAGLSRKFSSGDLSSSDLTKIIAAGLRGAGHDISEDEVAAMTVDGGVAGYVEIAARLLNATFIPIDVE